MTSAAPMQWSKIKKRFEDQVASSLRGRLQVHATSYKGGLDVGRGRITVNGEEVVFVQIPSFYSEHMYFPAETMDFGKAVGGCVELPIDALRKSPDILLRGLSFLDMRLGKRSLARVDRDCLHPFERALYEVRCNADRTADQPGENP